MPLPLIIEACVVLGIALALTIIAHRRKTKRWGLPLPPGPRGLPIIGNTFQMPRQHIASYFKKLCNEYGGFVSLQVGGSTLILLGDAALARELLEKRAARFSSRPVNLYFSRYVDPNSNRWVFDKVGRNYQNGRRLSAKAIASVRAGKQEPLAEYEALLTLQFMLDSPDEWLNHLKRFSASVALSAMFGTHFETDDAPQLKEILEDAKHNEDLSVAASPSASIINFLPWLDYIPGPMPWRKRAKELRDKDARIYQKFAEAAEKHESAGVETWAAMFRGKDKYGNELLPLINMFTEAAVDTTNISLQNFIFASVCFPESVKAAQAQLDDVVGGDRLPSFADKNDLPQVEAIVRETLRWQPALRASIPHQSTSDEVVDHNGKKYFIPAGSVVFGLPWAIERDEKMYPNPEAFIPARQLDENGDLREDYFTTTFGWGLRVCPGSPFAVRSLWINIAMILWTFDVQPLPGHTYHADDSAFAGGITAAPHKFPAIFKPRSQLRSELAKKAWSDCEGNLTDIMAKQD